MKFFDYILKAFIKDKAGTVARPVHHPNVVHRCPMCGVRARYHVCDIVREGRLVAQALICEEHSMYFVGDKNYEQSDAFAKIAVNAINEGLVTELH